MMEPAGELSNNIVTFVVSHRVKTGAEPQYEDWLREIIPLCQSYAGHLGTHVIRPHDDASNTFTVIIRFDHYRNLDTWVRSDDRARMIAKVDPILEEGDKITVKSGMDFWFTPEAVQAKIPTRWKQFLITWSAIYPLAILIPIVWKPFFQATALNQQPLIRSLFVTASIVFLMVYVVMPRYTRAVHKWLFR